MPQMLEKRDHVMNNVDGQSDDDSTSNSGKSSNPLSQTARDADKDTSEKRCVRRRIRRACDHCNSSRRKCDGQQPCAHCLHTRNQCEYKRQSKKRGKRSRTLPLYQASQDHAREVPQGQAPTQSEPISSIPIQSESLSRLRDEEGLATKLVEGDSNLMDASVNEIQDLSFLQQDLMVDDYEMFNLDDLQWTSQGFNTPEMPQTSFPLDSNAASPNIINGSSRLPGGSEKYVDSVAELRSIQRPTYGIHSFEPTDDDNDAHIIFTSSTTPDRGSHPLLSPTAGLNINKSNTLGQVICDITANRKKRQNSIVRPTTLPVPKSLRNASGLRYPVLHDVIHLLRPLIPDALAFDLLEAYFKVSPVTNVPLAPCAPPHIYRRSSFLRCDQPRRSSQVLLVSMLWLAAQTADIPVLNSSTARRKYVRRKLLVLTTSLLKPLNEVSRYDDIPDKTTSSSLPYSLNQSLGKSESSPDSSMTERLDEVMAYAHLAMVTSASEFKGASLRWWTLAFSLARESKLHQELTESLSSDMSGDDGYETMSDSHHSLSGSHPNEKTSEQPDQFTIWFNEERQEERLRVWWFLYSMDRHTSFSYNKPLSLLDGECQDLQRPRDDLIWQNDETYELSHTPLPGKGPWFECTGPTFFGFFTPLAALLGEIVYFVQAQNHPRFGVSQSTLLDWKKWEKGIEDRLLLYKESLQRLLVPLDTPSDNGEQQGYNEYHTNFSRDSPNPNSSSIPSTNTLPSYVPFQNRIANAYSKTIVHVLFILLTGRWDPLKLLNEPSDWLSTPSCISAISHAVDAASSAEILLDLDPDAHFMPFFTGVYLFHGSLPLLLVADRLGRDAAAAIVHAAETMIRVQEIGVLRMPAEYQVLFISVLRTALMEMKGRTLYLSDDPAARRRKMLKRYKWTPDGKGLAC